ncbi:MAG: M14-type cytosolic carboxypeptidase [Capsulimonadaceae bacterium]|nr:M14-type cytosolic carboxypeptidase [Capsulimonadaceae bacterium]
MKIDAEFPGGNILVEHIDGNTIDVRQDLRDTGEWWFWWALRVSGAAGRTLTFRFTNGDVFSACGPCASWNAIDWHWLGRTDSPRTSFTVTIPPRVDVAYFSFAPLYTQRHLERFLRELETRIAPGRVERGTLCASEHGRPVELLRVPAKRRNGARTVALIARTHACEVSANFVMEGILSEWLTAQSPGAAWLHENYELVVVPFMDKDGVEEGDQGKARKPHDHNRDFGASPLYASVRALQELLLGCKNRLDFYLDIHAPYLRDGINDTIFFTGQPQPWQTELDKLTALVEDIHDGHLPYHSADTIAHGVDWNKGLAASSAGWVQIACAPKFAGVLEVTYGKAHEVDVTPDGLREFGASLAKAMASYLRG